MKSEAKDETDPDPEKDTAEKVEDTSESKVETATSDEGKKMPLPAEKPEPAKTGGTAAVSKAGAENKDATAKKMPAPRARTTYTRGSNRRRSGSARPRFPAKGVEPKLWAPQTKLGRMVKDGEITNISDALGLGLPVREPEIIDILLPDLEDEVLDVNMVQRMTDSGRRVKFAITTVVGNEDGYVGLGHSKGKEVGPAIRKAIDNAKVNIIEVKRGCGSWECGCGKAHSLPFSVKGKSGSTEVYLKPAPRGIDLAVGNVAKHILKLAGIKDAWGFTRGETRTTNNYAKAVMGALIKTTETKVTDKQMKKLHIIRGSLGEIRNVGETTESKPETAAMPVKDEVKVKPASGSGSEQVVAAVTPEPTELKQEEPKGGQEKQLEDKE